MSAFLGTIRLLPGGAANVERVAVVRLGENTAEAARQTALAAAQVSLAAAQATAAATSATNAATSATNAANAGYTGGVDAVARAGVALTNLFDPARATANYYINSGSGTLAAAGSFHASDFIRVEPGGNISTLDALFGNGSGAGRAFYDASRTYISGSSANVTAGSTIAVPANAHYVRFTISSGLLYRTNVVRGSTAPTAYRAFAADDTFTARAAFIDRTDELFGHTPNLFNVAGITDNSYLNSGAGTVSQSSYFITNYMPVTPGASYVANFSTPGGAYGAFYDVNGAAINAFTVTAGTAITAPATAATLRISFGKTQTTAQYGNGAPVKNVLMIVEGASLPATYRAFGYADPFQAAEAGRKAARFHMPARINKYQRRGATTSTLLAASGGTTTDANYAMTDYIPVTPGKGLALSADFVAGNPNYGWNWYDDAFQRIGSTVATVTANTTNGSTTLTVTNAGTVGPLCVGSPISGTGIASRAYITAVPAGGPGSTGDYTMSAAATATNTGVTINGGGAQAKVAIVPPPSAAWGRISFPSSRLFDLVVADDDITSSGLLTPSNHYGAIGYMGWADIERGLPWAREVVAFLGDSIMQDATGNNAFQGGLENWLRANGTIFGGVSGRKTREVLGGSPGGTYSRGPTSAYVSGDFSAIKLVYCNAGTNDFGVWGGSSFVAPRPLGALGDTGASNTFHGDLYDTYIAKLQTWNPAMRIAISTPLPRFDNGATGNPTNSNGVTLQAYADAMLAFGARYSIPVMDLFRLSGMNAASQASFLSDGLHPSLAGYNNRLVPLIGKWLNTL